jgi:hypothetical protein
VIVPAPLAAGLAGPFADAVAGLAVAAELVRARGAWAGAPLAVAGAAALVVGARWPRGLAVLGGAALGAFAAASARGGSAAHVGLAPGVAAALAAASGGALGAAWPAAFPFAVGAVPGAILGAGVPLSGRALLGAAAGAALGGVVGLLVGRPAATVLVALLGGALVSVGGVGLLGQGPLAAELCAHPFSLAAEALVAGIAGAAYQIARGSVPARRALEPADRR